MSWRKRLGAVCAAVAMVMCGTGPAWASWGTDDQHQLVPLYVYPDWWNTDDDWERACEGSNTSDIGSTMIANLGYEADGVAGGGPSTARNTDYATVIGDCHRLGQNVLGYVSTRYGAQTLAEAKEDIDAWYSYYDGNRTGAYEWNGSAWVAATTADMHVDGIFFDEVPTDPAASTNGTDNVTAAVYYRELFDYVRAKDPNHVYDQVVVNPGAAASTDWQLDDQPIGVDGDPATQIADETVVFEGPFDDGAGIYGLDGYSSPAWVDDYPASDTAMLVYDTDSADIGDACGRTQDEGAGLVFVTPFDVGTATPWNDFPDATYWASFRSSCG